MFQSNVKLSQSNQRIVYLQNNHSLLLLNFILSILILIVKFSKKEPQNPEEPRPPNTFLIFLTSNIITLFIINLVVKFVIPCEFLCFIPDILCGLTILTMFVLLIGIIQQWTSIPHISSSVFLFLANYLVAYFSLENHPLYELSNLSEKHRLNILSQGINNLKSTNKTKEVEEHFKTHQTYLTYLHLDDPRDTEETQNMLKKLFKSFSLEAKQKNITEDLNQMNHLITQHASLFQDLINKYDNDDLTKLQNTLQIKNVLNKTIENKYLVSIITDIILLHENQSNIFKNKNYHRFLNQNQFNFFQELDLYGQILQLEALCRFNSEANMLNFFKSNPDLNQYTSNSLQSYEKINTIIHSLSLLFKTKLIQLNNLNEFLDEIYLKYSQKDISFDIFLKHVINQETINEKQIQEIKDLLIHILKTDSLQGIEDQLDSKPLKSFKDKLKEQIKTHEDNNKYLENVLNNLKIQNPNELMDLIKDIQKKLNNLSVFDINKIKQIFNLDLQQKHLGFLRSVKSKFTNLSDYLHCIKTIQHLKQIYKTPEITFKQLLNLLTSHLDTEKKACEDLSLVFQDNINQESLQKYSEKLKLKTNKINQKIKNINALAYNFENKEYVESLMTMLELKNIADLKIFFKEFNETIKKHKMELNLSSVKFMFSQKTESDQNINKVFGGFFTNNNKKKYLEAFKSIEHMENFEQFKNLYLNTLEYKKNKEYLQKFFNQNTGGLDFMSNVQKTIKLSSLLNTTPNLLEEYNHQIQIKQTLENLFKEIDFGDVHEFFLMEVLKDLLKKPHKFNANNNINEIFDKNFLSGDKLLIIKEINGLLTNICKREIYSYGDIIDTVDMINNNLCDLKLPPDEFIFLINSKNSDGLKELSEIIDLETEELEKFAKHPKFQEKYNKIEEFKIFVENLINNDIIETEDDYYKAQNICQETINIYDIIIKPNNMNFEEFINLLEQIYKIKQETLVDNKKYKDFIHKHFIVNFLTFNQNILKIFMKLKPILQIHLKTNEEKYNNSLSSVGKKPQHIKLKPNTEWVDIINYNPFIQNIKNNHLINLHNLKNKSINLCDINALDISESNKILYLNLVNNFYLLMKNIHLLESSISNQEHHRELLYNNQYLFFLNKINKKIQLINQLYKKIQLFYETHALENQNISTSIKNKELSELFNEKYIELQDHIIIKSKNNNQLGFLQQENDAIIFKNIFNRVKILNNLNEGVPMDNIFLDNSGYLQIKNQEQKYGLAGFYDYNIEYTNNDSLRIFKDKQSFVVKNNEYLIKNNTLKDSHRFIKFIIEKNKMNVFIYFHEKNFINNQQYVSFSITNINKATIIPHDQNGTYIIKVKNTKNEQILFKFNLFNKHLPNIIGDYNANREISALDIFDPNLEYLTEDDLNYS